MRAGRDLSIDGLRASGDSTPVELAQDVTASAKMKHPLELDEDTLRELRSLRYVR